MAQSRQKQRKRRKTRGTQAGTVKKSRNPRGARGHSRAASKMTSAQKRQQRMDRPPSWRTAIVRSLATAAFLLVVFALLLKTSIPSSLQFAVMAAFIYAPAFYFVDSFTYNRRQRQKQREREQEAGK